MVLNSTTASETYRSTNVCSIVFPSVSYCNIMSLCLRSNLISLSLSSRNQKLHFDDCYCKGHLQPTAPSFDVLCNSYKCTQSTTLPHIATICYDAIFYRSPLSYTKDCSEWVLERYASFLFLLDFRLSCNWNWNWIEFIHHIVIPSFRGNSETVQYQGVRLANITAISSFDSNYGTNTDDVSVIVGCALHDFSLDSHYNFAIQKTSQRIIQGHHTPVKVYPLRGPVNDFRFKHDGSLQGKP